MKFKIDSEILEKTDCDKNFVCLDENADKKICKITKCLENQYCFLKEFGEVSCDSCFAFGYYDVCKCPTRIEIFKKYGI